MESDIELLETYPGTEFKTARFSGGHDSLIDIDNSFGDLDLPSFTIIMYLKPDSGTFNRASPLFSWLSEVS